MRDVQSSNDARGIAIQKVGVTDVHLPFQIKTQAGAFQSVLARIRLTVDLLKEYKGTHMSRFIEALFAWSQKPVSYREIEQLLNDVLQRLDARRAGVCIQFKYFIEKTAPVTGLKSILDYDCSFSGQLIQGERLAFTLGLAVPFTSLCPCSKEIADYGAHNQRGVMRVQLRQRPGKFIWIEELVALLEQQASCPVFPLLKREDEKYVTEKAYENPKFVEDVLRDMVLALRGVDGIEWFEAECETFESIHNHNAYASHSEHCRA
ncbi:MAG: GTP cyclohydrolase FolE2 [Sporomusaceae bacterium]|nr:GTP cyclohydrolase FolE2 [Sporomusaceae bacterium]